MRSAMLVCSLFMGPAGNALGHEGRRHHAPAATPEPRAVEASRPAVAELAALRAHLRQAEYWHVLLNPMPPLGMAAGTLVLLAAFAAPALAEAGLGLIAAAGLAAGPVIWLGQRAYDRLFDLLPPDAQQWLDVHMERAEKTQFLFYLAAIVALAGIVQARRGSKSAKPLRLAALALGAACAAVSGWIAHAGGQVSHPEFRAGPPPASALRIVPSKAAEHHDDYQEKRP